MNIELTMHRYGEYEIKNPVDVEYKCGLEGRFTYTYDVFITTDDNLPAPNYFIIDNNEIQNYFEKKYETKEPTPAPSCEIMAITSLKDIAKIMESYNVNILKISVKIHGTAATNFTAEWKKE